MRRIAMSEKEKEEQQHPGQKIFDNIWLLFILSLLISTLIYNVWGIIDLLNVPLAP
jgi:zona occludens toxin (predicted ATPase)